MNVQDDSQAATRDALTQVRGSIGEPPPSRLRIGLASALLAVWTVVILVVTLRPRPVTEGNEAVINTILEAAHSAGIPSSFGHHAFQYAANIAMFVPFGFLLALVLPQRSWWIALLGVPAFSGLIEMSQALFLSARFADISDVVANTIGGWFGLACAFGLRALIRVRDRRLIERTLHFAGVSVDRA